MPLVLANTALVVACFASCLFVAKDYRETVGARWPLYACCALFAPLLAACALAVYGATIH